MLPNNQALLLQEADGTIRHDPPRPAALLPGSFNPLHQGHRLLAETAARLLQAPIVFELSVDNVDKPSLGAEEIRRRLAQFMGFAPIVATRAATFAAKALLFPGAVFVVGSDTAVRIVDPAYYGSEPGRRDEALRIIHEAGCRFLVAGRTNAAGNYLPLEALTIPDPFGELFMPMAGFRVDLSSTELRRGRDS